jgi:hypothetical protein
MTGPNLLAVTRRALLGLGLIWLGTMPLQACNRAPDKEPVAGQAPVSDQEPAAKAAAVTGGVSARNTPYHYSSDEGQYQVTWPSGCSRLRVRTNEPEFFEGEEPSATMKMHHVVCEQFGVGGEGCSVAAVFDAPGTDGGPAGPDQVVARVGSVLKAYGVTVVRETPIRKVFAENLVAEGVDVKGTASSGEGQFWVRGVLVGPDIYVLTAWSQKGNLWENPEYQEFFNGFLPFAE